MKFAFIAAKRGDFPVTWLCRRLEVSASGFYRWLEAGEPARHRRDRQLGVHIRACHVSSRGTYGSPRIHRELAVGGVRVGTKRGARIMREHGLSGLRPRRFRKTTDSDHGDAIADDLVKRDFAPTAPNTVWASDITYVRTWAGWLYLAVVIDLYSRRVVGWAIADHMRTELVLTALERAIRARRPAAGLVHHSDRGSQYASHAHRQALTARGFLCSMSRKGDCWDNSVVESFFGTLKQELLYRRPWPTKESAVDAIGDFIDRFYNPRRRHSTLGYTSPMEYETLMIRAQMAA